MTSSSLSGGWEFVDRVAKLDHIRIKLTCCPHDRRLTYLQHRIPIVALHLRSYNRELLDLFIHFVFHAACTLYFTPGIFP
ncbi:hypothetical protein BS47DRAFT_1293596 [Hydnum rufescens UP504]|uniref:Uncharacterized protein n=1 Tax=Hydnum rufescens UP504 TaxID=1448309 RepID=A0A9P6B2A1_9AGAM|nr:hypothetical protein BS47DRAFT_1293596 [Hydnum rufescens UP504]